MIKENNKTDNKNNNDYYVNRDRENYKSNNSYYDNGNRGITITGIGKL